LFTLGIGHYTETDVKEAARALTGWTLVRGDFTERPADHDADEKTILGYRGRWKGEDLVRILLEHPATAHRLAWRLVELFMGRQTVDAAGLAVLAAGLREHHLDIGWAAGTVLRSRAFFAEANWGNRVWGPVEYVVGVVRALEYFDSSPSSLLLGEWAARSGQDLFAPPNVGGWPGGRAWLTTQSVIARANFAAALVEGKLSARSATFDGVGLARRHGRGSDLDDLLTFYAELLTGAPPDADWRKRLHAALGGQTAFNRETVGSAVALILASPEVQLA
jgi:uncharacterized protein (DUF1800 family)